MSVANLLARARAAGVAIWLESGQPRYRGPRQALAELLPELRSHRDDVVRHLAASSVSTLGPDGQLHPRLAALIGAYCQRHQFTRSDLQEALEIAAATTDPAACWAFYEAADRGGDDRIACPMCARLAGVQCSAKGFAPVLDVRRRCGDYTPTAGDPDRRTGELRWPGLME